MNTRAKIAAVVGMTLGFLVLLGLMSAFDRKLGPESVALLGVVPALLLPLTTGQNSTRCGSRACSDEPAD